MVLPRGEFVAAAKGRWSGAKDNQMSHDDDDKDDNDDDEIF